MKKICFCVNIMLLIFFTASAQAQKDSADKKIKPVFVFLPSSALQTIDVKQLPANYYYSCLGFFCKTEWKIEKTTKFPLKIRVGSVEYCDKMESK